MKRYIRLEPLEDIPRKPGKNVLTEEEKTQRLLELEKKLNINIGENNTYEDR